MSGWSGSGVFTRFYNWVADNAGGEDITASRFDSENDTFAAGINNCLTKNGENSPTLNLPMATYKHTGVGASAARTEYLRVAEFVDGAHIFGTSGGAADVQTLTVSPAFAAYTSGQRFIFIPGYTNTGACTLNVSAVGEKSIKLTDGTDPAAGDITTSGVADVQYDGTNFVLFNPATVLPTGTQTLTNKALIAPTIDGIATSTLVVLDSPETLTTTTPTLSTWTSTSALASTTLTTATAKTAIVRMYLSETAAASTLISIGGSVRKAGSSVTSTNGIVCQSFNKDVTSQSMSATCAGEALVNLDGSYDFEYYITNVNATALSAFSLILVGYYV